jgi:XTP/dITP diphosphohydrolase
MIRPTLFATSNLNKLAEFSAILGYSLEQVALSLPEPQSLDVSEIARAKAVSAYHETFRPVLVEDSSLAFEAWNGLPGPFVRWFLETVGKAGLVRMMMAEDQRRAVARTAVAFHDGTETHVFVGELAGTIAREVRGDKDFGWGPIFIPDGYEQTFAEMERETKHAISMRFQALQKLKAFLEGRN